MVDNSNVGYCCGNNFDGQLGQGNFKRYNVPTPLLGNITWRTISAGDWHACGLALNGDAYCWGYNEDGRCGIGSTKSPLTKPTKVAGGFKWKQISAGYFYSCGVREDGAAFCFGKNNYGRLGDGQVVGNTSSPVQVGKDKDWVEMLAGGDHTCGRKKDRTVWCFGSNNEGQLARPPEKLLFSTKPIKVPGTYKFLTSNSKYACGIKPSGEGMCWGSNVWGQLGLNKKVNQTYVPSKIASPGTWRQLAAGQFVTCGIKSDNTGHCWGAGYLAPIRFKPDGWVTMVAGDWNGAGVFANGSAAAWWENEWGEGGVGRVGYLKEPTPVVGGSVWGPPNSTYA